MQNPTAAHKPNSLISLLLAGDLAAAGRRIGALSNTLTSEALDELEKIARQTEGSVVSIDTNTQEVIGFTGSDTATHAHASEQLSDIAGYQMMGADNIRGSLEADLNDSLYDVTHNLDGAALVLKCKSEGNNDPDELSDLAELAQVGGFSSSIAFMFFNSAEERGAAAARGLETVIMYQEPKSTVLHILTTPQDVSFGTARQKKAFPNRMELSLNSLAPDRKVFRAKQIENNRVLAPHTPLRKQPIQGEDILTSGYTMSIPKGSYGATVMGAIREVFMKQRRELEDAMEWENSPRPMMG